MLSTLWKNKRILPIWEVQCALVLMSAYYDKNSRVFNIYKQACISERHRHRYEFNNDFEKEFEENGMMCVGRNPESDLVEIVEIPSLKWFIGTQFHPEYQSTVLKPHPLFLDFIKTAIENKKK